MTKSISVGKAGDGSNSTTNKEGGVASTISSAPKPGIDKKPDLLMVGLLGILILSLGLLFSVALSRLIG